MAEGERISAVDWLAAGNGPRDEEEATDVARALYQRRELQEQLDRLDALTPFERALAERAARAARDAVISGIERIIGHTAETISAPALRQSLQHLSARLDFERPRVPGFDFRSEPRVRAAELVAGAVRQAEAEEQRRP
jgi:hypothetical protein